MPIRVRETVGGRLPPSRVTPAGVREAATIEQPSGVSYSSQVDPIGLALQLRGLGAARRGQAEHLNADINAPSSVSTMLPDPAMEGLKQALFEAGTTHLAGGPSVAGSNQLRGESVPTMSTLDIAAAPAGYTGGRFTKSVDEAARTGQMPSYLYGSLPSTRRAFTPRLKGARELLDALTKQATGGK